MDTPCDLCAEKGRDCTYTKISRKRGPEPSRKSSKGQPPKIDPVPETLVKLTLDTSPQPARILKTFQIDPLSLSIPENQAVFPEFFSSPSASPTILPVAHWDASVFLSTIVIDCNGNSGSILDLYFAFPHQHLPMFSKQWFTQNIQDVPTHVLRAIYILVLVNASQSPESLLIAKLHAEHLRFLITNQEEVIDPFTVSSILNLAMFDNYNHDYQKSNSLLGLAIKAAKILGLHLDPDLKWPSTASGRILGGELGMGRQFLRSLWFLMYHWDHHNSVLYKTPLLIDNLISQEAIDSYFQPNVGDQSNVPLK